MKKFTSFLLGSILMFPLITGCAVHGGVYVRTYGPAEAPYYTRWENETHREHIDYGRRKRAEQHEYWEWRRHHEHD